MHFLKLREPGYALLCGEGIEIGGFEHPAHLPNARRITRCDRLLKEEVAAVFSEIAVAGLPPVDVRLDLDTDGLGCFADESLDFVVCCHVLEHLKNPIKALGEIMRTLPPGGRAALAIPDKTCTFDRDRPLTEWSALARIYRERITTPVPADYLDIVRYVHPQMLAVGEAERHGYLEHLLRRREHLNIWDSHSYADFLVRSAELLGVRWRSLYVAAADQSHFEYFTVLEKS
jgi:SAM-dependent methyltransferase